MRRLLCLLLALALVALACGDDGGGSDADPPADEDSPSESPDPVDTASLAPAPDDPILDRITVTGDIGSAPTVDFETPLVADTTARRALVEGDGDVSTAGANVSVRLIALVGSDGSTFDDNFDAEAQSLQLDPTALLPGLYRILVDVPAGTRLVAVLAAADGFGPQGGVPDSGLGADDTLVFVIDVESVSTPLDRAEGTVVDPPDGLPTVDLGEDGKPSIALADGDPPAELIVQPLIEGNGAVVEDGQRITVHYTGIVWPGGEQFDSSWDRGEPTAFPIGTGGVITGWDQGLVGHPIGSQILLVIPPDLGYGTDGNPQAGIEGTDTLVFVVDILDAS